MKVKVKKEKVSSTAEEVAEEVEEASVETAETGDEGLDEDADAEEAPAPEPAPKTPEQAVINQTPKDRVRVTIIKDMAPPTVGNYDMEREHRVTKLVSRESYLVPRHVAEVLTDCGAAITAA